MLFQIINSETIDKDKQQPIILARSATLNQPYISTSTGGHFVRSMRENSAHFLSNSIFTTNDKNTNFGAIFSHFTLKYVCLTIHKLTGKGRKILKTNCRFKIGCGIKYIFAGKHGIFGC